MLSLGQSCFESCPHHSAALIVTWSIYFPEVRKSQYPAMCGAAPHKQPQWHQLPWRDIVSDVWHPLHTLMCQALL